jgi:DNA-binding XRE family transcriptional regulator
MALRTGKCLLRQRLRQAEMTQTELAERVNLSRIMISHFCTGRKKMNLNQAKAISDVLNCSIEDLYTWEHSSGEDE